MDLKQYIFKRKSTRKYDLTELDTNILNQINDFAKSLKPLYGNIKIQYNLVGLSDIKNILPVKSPHYFVISSEKKEGYLENVGFMFQQMDLYLSSLGLGSCWLGMARVAEKINTNLEFVIILAFGKPLESPYRELSEFKRKSLDEISNKVDDRLEPARLAPSATNSQPWYFVIEDDNIHVYRAKLNPVKALIYEKMNAIDMGIMLAHLYISDTDKFNFVSQKHPDIKGYNYIGTKKTS